jgi:hypothetical protein
MKAKRKKARKDYKPVTGGVRIKLRSGKIIEVPRTKIVQNGILRPRMEAVNGVMPVHSRVWQIADSLSAKLRRVPFRQEMLTACGQENEANPERPITYHVFQNAFYSWRKFNGVAGRVKVDGTIGRVTGGSRRPTNSIEVPAMASDGIQAQPVIAKGRIPAPPPKEPVTVLPVKTGKPRPVKKTPVPKATKPKPVPNQNEFPFVLPNLSRKP